MLNKQLLYKLREIECLVEEAREAEYQRVYGYNGMNVLLDIFSL